MSIKGLFSSEYFPSLQNSDEFFEKTIKAENAGRRILRQLLLLCILSFLYGVIMGSYHSVIQAIAAGVKVCLLFNIVLLICFPAFFIVQYILGSKLKLFQMISIVLSGFILTASILVSFAPIVIIFLLTGSNYYFLQLLHIAIYIFSGVFGMVTIIRALKFSCERKNVYPQTGVVVFRFWVVILAFVGIQLAWNFRPFLGDRDKPFELFRDYEGNFYAALIYSIDQLIDPTETSSRERKALPEENPTVDTLTLNQLFQDSALGK